MARLRSAQGVVVNVSDEKAARLGSGWVTLDDEPATEDKPAPRKRAAKSDSK